MADLATIERLTKSYAAARDELADAVKETNSELERIKRQKIPLLRRRTDAASNARAKLEAAIQESPQLFGRPKTLTLYGIRVGFQKGKGKIEISDPEVTIRLIRKHLPDLVDSLVKVEEKPVKAALNNLSTAELRKIGCTVTEAGDVVLIKATDGEIDKLVEALLKESDEAAQPEPAQAED
ncbi:hypothetical protein SAMN06265365_14813 [Tistlia consotensis]|uniref:Mu-like prophage host-nuclease inhibitor protein Gam n=1 Tax=Tistlia consotensis USBA 355 TaxID=560819 RepID=A0A1Y6CX55_9PROT|nr:host-nuclease inhibitor Gam family protein [Tistlia consotensis]SMF82866.1 hypothetical protein SAMN05428998_14814 [Tistlia consotensis USBA 355]SNS31215.1 hypothetical protein SAMN06265365_14813 [Tistlia consotensis]